MAWQVIYHEDVPEDLRAIPRNLRARMRRAIEERLMTEPAKYGERLRKDLAGAWKLRVGDYRIVFDLLTHSGTVRVLLIAHRRSVYGTLPRRIRRRG